MPNRRDFFKAIATATAGVVVADRGFADARALPLQGAPARRREVFVGSRRVKVVDVHCHCIVPEVAEVVKGTNLASSGGNQTGPSVLGPAPWRVMDREGLPTPAHSNYGS